MQTIRQYAESRGISYEAVRRQVVEVYPEELAKHIQIIGNTKYIDDEGIQFLDTKRNASAVVIDTAVQLEELERLREENKKLHAELEKLQGETINKLLIALDEKHTLADKLIESGKHSNQLLISELESERDRKAEEIEQLHQKCEMLSFNMDKANQEKKRLEEDAAAHQSELDSLREQLAEARTEADAYSKSIFGLYKRKKK